MASTTSDARLQAEDHRYLWHPFTQQREWEQEPPLIIDRGRGVYLEDTDGRRYLDGVSSLWVNPHGHRKRELDRALAAQLRKIAHSTLLGLANVPSIELASRLVALAPQGLTRVFYSDDGSTAVEVALKMAYQYWQVRGGPDKSKKSFLHLGLAYHGDTLGAVSVGGVPLFHERFKPLLFPTYEAHAPYCYRCPLNLTYPKCRVACADAVEDVLKRHHRHIAALIVEPMLLAAGGMSARGKSSVPRSRRSVACCNRSANIRTSATSASSALSSGSNLYGTVRRRSPTRRPSVWACAWRRRPGGLACSSGHSGTSSSSCRR